VAASLALTACGGDGGDRDDSGSAAGAPPSGLESGSQDASSDLAQEASDALSQLDAEERDGNTVVTLPEQVLFAFGEHDLLPDASATLDRLAEAVAYLEDAPVQVNGHTDGVGSDASNQTLSEQRAQAVTDHLIEAGVDTERITTQGLGESEPVASNDTDDGRAQNRRVEVIIEGVDPADVGA
jgi:outer membrane protein OmpA-like peptidoglycan-associated protein